MRMLVLGGTVFVSRTVVTSALARGHEVVCAARGSSGSAPDGASLVKVDRDAGIEAYAPLRGEEFDAVVDVATMDPAWVRDALRSVTARHWTFVSSISVYANHDVPGQTPATGELLPALHEKPAEFTPDSYGGAKVGSELAVAELFDGPAFLVRPGLIVGHGDTSDRYGYWPARFARGGEVLVGDDADQPTSFIDVRDLAEWIVDAGERRLAGTFDAVCTPVPLREALDRTAAGVGGPAFEYVPTPMATLEEHGVQAWSGPRSLPIHAPADPAWSAFMDHDVTASYDAGMRTRPIEEVAAAALEHERRLGLDRERKAGMSAADEAEVLRAIGR